MTANVTIIVDSRKNVLGIPNAALRFRPRDIEVPEPSEGRKWVWVVGDDEPESVAVVTGIDDYIYTELTQGELSEGQQVITGYAEN